MKAVVAVAHPDDCVIFAWPFIEAHPEFEWEIVYLTYTDTDARAKEMQEYWRKYNVPTKFLGFRDEYEDQLTKRLNFWNGLEAKATLTQAVEHADLIVTHNADGDYGHIHHKFVHDCLELNGIPKVYFASTFNYNTKYVTTNPVDTDLLPLHKEVIDSIVDRDTGLYIVTGEAKQIFKL
jgi:hypothetical protein